MTTIREALEGRDVKDPKLRKLLESVSGQPEESKATPTPPDSSPSPRESPPKKSVSSPPPESKKMEILPAPGYLGFVRASGGIDEFSLLTSITIDEFDKQEIYIAIPTYNNQGLSALTDDVNFDKAWDGTPKRKEIWEALELLKQILAENKWKEVRAFSPTRKGNYKRFGEIPFYGSILVIENEKGWWELPPGIYEADFLKKGGKIPEKAVNIKDYQAEWDVHCLTSDEIKLDERVKKVKIEYLRYAGDEWILYVVGPKDFVYFYEKRLNPANNEIIAQLHWIVRKTPEAVKKYLDTRFGAILGLNNIIYAPRNKIGAIIGKDRNHLISLAEILEVGVDELEVKPFKN